MPQTTLQTVFQGLATGTIALVGTFSGILTGISAQAQLPNCQAPRSNEFLLLIVTRTPDAQARVRSVISRDASMSVCNYFGEQVTRVGGYRDADTANSWANYLNDTVRLRAFVAVPPGGGQVARQGDVPPTRAASQIPQGSQPLQAQPDLPTAAANQPDLSDTTSTQAYNPQQLGEGFAVIVNFYNRPEVASQIQQVLNRNIGLAAFEQRPYLLAVHTSDRGIADSILQTLSDRGFAARLVRSSRVTLLTPIVQTNPAVGGQ